ncbi:MAG: tRNA-dihydrouridine synthase [Spirochaetales bacterium]|nr:tRNA-dihydrouridine synthase [Spirochaetales bacterium]
MRYQHLSAPIRIGGLSLSNRIVMPPLVIWASDQSGLVNETHLNHYRERKGPGLVIVEATAVSPEGRLKGSQLCLFNTAQAQGLERLAEVIRRNGSVPGIQLHHAGGKTRSEYLYGETPLVPSASRYPSGQSCRELSRPDISRIQEDFVRAARTAADIGYEYIELHGAHGYLGCQFLSPKTNARNDEYGGSLSNRQRFLLECYEAAAREVGSRALVTVRLGAAENNGLTLDEGIDTARRLSLLGAPLLHVSNGHDVPSEPPLPGSPYSSIMQLGISVRQQTGIPVIGVGGVTDPSDAESLIADGLVDLVAVGKGILADPEWAMKTLEGREDSIVSCIGCSPCRWFSDPGSCPAVKKRGAV